MPILHVRDVPQDLYAQLQRRATAQRRSLSAEVITLLDWALKETARDASSTLQSIRQLSLRPILTAWSMPAWGSSCF